MRDSDYTLVIPTYNGGDLWKQCIAGILSQSNPPSNVVVVDSSSSDDTCLAAEQAGFRVVSIPQSEFDHGGTRTFSLQFVKTGYVVFLTQDAILAEEDSISNLLSIFSDKSVGAAFGRQLPHYDANPLSAFARLCNYRSESYVTNLKASAPKGFKKAYMSNSFAAYRMTMLKEEGAFPSKLILAEDFYVAAKLLMSGRSVAYVSDAFVRHSHNYSVLDEFKRYFDIGVSHTTQQWMLDELGSVEGEGVKFALTQLVYLFKEKKIQWLIPSIFASAAKFFGYKLGRHYKKIPRFFCYKLSMYKGYWKKN
jgi:rhamnosyltransferase